MAVAPIGSRMTHSIRHKTSAVGTDCLRPQLTRTHSSPLEEELGKLVSLIPSPFEMEIDGFRAEPTTLLVDKSLDLLGSLGRINPAFCAHNSHLVEESDPGGDPSAKTRFFSL